MPQKILQILGTLVHQLQKERGCAALYSGSLGNKFSEEIRKQFIETDEIVCVLNEEYKLWEKSDLISSINISKINAYLQNISLVEKKREAIIDFSFPASELINFYTYKAISPLLDIMVKIALFEESNDPHNVSAYANLLYWKERTGRERAIGMRGFLSKNFNSQNFIERMKSLILEQESYKRTFLALVNDTLKENIERILKQSNIISVEKVHQALESDLNAKSLNSMTPEGWYEVMTTKIDLMYEIELSLIDSLGVLDQIDLPKATTVKANRLGVDTLNAKQKDFVNSLPFFSGIDEDKLSLILSNARTKEYKKGNLLFLEGEQATRLYIVLDGWVKLFKGTVAGEETILQMLSSGNTIAESAVFLNSPHPTSAQIAENAVLLAIPAPIIREQIRNSTELAINMITNMSKHSQSLMHHIESTRLKSANERVGWFLLKLLLDKDWLLDAVELPYDKSMIASYLDMKPETFSRTLKHFKKHNFKIENNTIILPDINALCGFCDIDTALTCSKHGTSGCSSF